MTLKAAITRQRLMTSTLRTVGPRSATRAFHGGFYDLFVLKIRHFRLSRHGHEAKRFERQMVPHWSKRH
jgi:hypothetical protein